LRGRFSTLSSQLSRLGIESSVISTFQDAGSAMLTATPHWRRGQVLSPNCAAVEHRNIRLDILSHPIPMCADPVCYKDQTDQMLSRVYSFLFIVPER
jgi:hypothetical protein